jgi:transcriptional regulator GlxA family with amidase domain
MVYRVPELNLQHRRIAMIIYPGCVMMDACGPLEAFSFANLALELAGKITEQTPVYSMCIIAEQKGPVKTSSGITIEADYGFEDIPSDIDTLIIAGMPRVLDVLKDAKLREFLKSMSARVRRVVSICTGALFLAESEILNGRRATTHWLFCDFLASHYHDVRVEPDKVFVRDGNVYTSGGVTAGIDLALSLVEEDWGWEVASGAARGMLVFMRRPGGQSQFGAYMMNEARTRKDFRELQAWVVSNPKADLSVESLAERMNMSPRNFTRVFCQEVGVTPAKFVERIRVEAARNMILKSDSPVESIAGNCGFHNAEQMRRSFQRILNTSPQDYRSNFKQSLA